MGRKRTQPHCIYCLKMSGKLPADMKLYCSLKCLYTHTKEQHMDWALCERCNEWYDTSYECYNPEIDI